MRPARRPSFAVAAVCLAGLTACGTTVPLAGAQGAATGTGPVPNGVTSPGQVVSGLGGPPQGSGAGAVAGVAAAGPITGPSGSTGGGGGSVGVANGSSSSSGPVGAGLGFTATTLQIGVTTNKDAQATLKTVGIASGSLGDQEAMTKAVMSDINAQGGIFGRKLEPVFHDVKTMDTSSNPSGAAQAACVDFTQDHHVAAAIDLVLDSRLFSACMVKQRAFVVASGLTFTDKPYVQGLTPYFFRLASPLAENLIPTYLSRLKALGYFSGWDTTAGRPGIAPVRVGLFYLDEAAPTRAFNNIAARLAAMGYQVSRYAYSRQDSSYENAVLQFKSAGVTHIIGDNASYVLLMAETQSQSYYPRYGMTSYNGGGVLLQQAAPPAALAGALGVGWAPSVDVDAQRDPGPTGPAYTRCLQTMARHNVDVSTRAALATALGICDGLQVLAQSMRAGGGFDGPHITAGRATFSFEATATFSGTHNEGSIAIPTAVRDYGYQSSCSCFAYLSKTNRALA